MIEVIAVGLIVVGFFVSISKFDGCAGWLVGFVVMFIILWFFDPILEANRPPPTAEEIENRKMNARIKAREDRDYAIEQMNRAMAKGKNDEALIWNEKAMRAQEQLRKNTVENEPASTWVARDSSPSPASTRSPSAPPREVKETALTGEQVNEEKTAASTVGAASEEELKGTLILLQRATFMTDSEVFGLDFGSKVELYMDKGDTVLIRAGAAITEVPRSAVRNAWPSDLVQ